MSLPNSWTPHSYPVQAPPPPGVPLTSEPVPTPAENGTTITTGKKGVDGIFDSSAQEDEVPKLPRNIRALRHGDEADKLQGRTIIIALDGTGDKFDADNSNIVHLVSCLKKSDPSQITYYQSGIGTYDGGGLSNGVNAAFDMAVGSGLGVHIRDAYRFLMQTYHENDRICLFGFSRGAYTARCLAGMIHKVGLLPAHNSAQVPFAYEYYKDASPEGWKMSNDFKRTFCVDVSVHFIGVFDSVASVGFIPRRLPLSATPTNKATYFRHAMALDEHRAKFKVCRFQSESHAGPDSHWETMAELHEDTIAGQPARRFSSSLGANATAKSIPNGLPNGVEKEDEQDDPETDLYIKRRREEEQAKETDVLEVWFAGAHCDVGGGAVKNEERHKLAQVPLRWMLRQCFLCDTGIIFKAHRLAEEGLDVHTLWPVYTSLSRPVVGPAPSLIEKHEKGEIAPINRRSTVLHPVDSNDPQGLHQVRVYSDKERQEMHKHWVPEQVEDYFDSISPINDQLAKSKSWWILELWPIKVRVQSKNSDEWVKEVAMNRGRYRAVQDIHPNLHWTVQQRMETKGYKTRVRVDRKGNWNVVV